MNTRLGHIQFNVRAANLPFYKNLATFLEWPVIFETEGMLGIAGKSNDSLWFIGEVKDAANDYDGPGMNHIAFATETQAEVDQAVSHLRANGIATLFETPRHRPEFAGSEGETYYQVMFESPDRILVEIVYTGAKSA